MPHDTTLLFTIVIGLTLAACGGFLAHRLRLPPLVGYLLAGVAIGPFTPGLNADVSVANQLAEFGIILLMFGVGLHFSVSDLLAVRRIALPGAFTQIIAATSIGAGIAITWGWNLLASVVFGLALSCASTVVLLRALEERNELDSPDGNIAVGWLVVEDLVMVLVLVLLPAMTVFSNSRVPPSDINAFAWVLAITLVKLIAFVALVLLVGTRLVPWVLNFVARTESRELFTLSVLALALGIAYGSAEFFDVSFALGAFFAGVVLSESDFSHQAAADSLPLKDAFAVLFFVSVGMLFDPTILLLDPLSVIAVVLVIVFGKSLAAFAIVVAFGYPAATALTVSASLAQIGEFSFIVAGLGTVLGILPPEGRDLLIAGAILSITANPLMFAAIHPLERWLHSRPRLLKRFELQERVLNQLPEEQDHLAPRNHAVLVGYGRVGEVIGEALKSQGLPFVVIEANRRRVESLRRRGIRAIYGDSTVAGVLAAAQVHHARLLLIATPGGFRTQRTLEIARRIAPHIQTAVRTHSVKQINEFERQGVGVAMMGETELALGLLNFALKSFELSDEKSHAIVQAIRHSRVGIFVKPEPALDSSISPELRPHRDGNNADIDL